MAENVDSERKLMEDSYYLITGRKSFEEVLEDEKELAVIFNPYQPIKVMDGDAYDCLIEYYISTEEYEKCDELMQMKELNQLINL
jgi:hypothetical protein|tara:strand:+ start:6637 stop:6891 length:255 start_codon:yes stop_codon:yes gene_type:complete